MGIYLHTMLLILISVSKYKAKERASRNGSTVVSYLLSLKHPNKSFLTQSIYFDIFLPHSILLFYNILFSFNVIVFIGDENGFELLQGSRQNIVIPPSQVELGNYYIGIYDIWGHTALPQESHDSVRYTMYVNKYAGKYLFFIFYRTILVLKFYFFFEN